MQRKILCLAVIILTGFALSAAAQQTVNRFDFMGGYSHLSSPSVSLEQNGFNTTFGVNMNRWLALGADFSWFTGDGKIPVTDTKVYDTLKPFLGGTNPKVPFSAHTYTFAAGPQINIRHFDKVMFFVRPGLGLLHERAKPTISPALVPLLPLVPGLKPQMNDTVPFYGVGGGFEWNASEHVGLRFSADFVHTSLFADLLQGRNAVRLTVAPTFKWGKLRAR